MVVSIDTACADSDHDDSTHSSLEAEPVAKRATAPEGGSPAYKARRRSRDMHAMRHLRTSPKIADGKMTEKAEILEPSETLEQRLRFVSLAGDANGSNSEAYVSGLARQMQKMCITQIQEVQQEMVQTRPETNASLRHDTESVSTPEKPQACVGLWRMCAKPGSEKDIHTTEEDGWQIVEEYGEKTPPRRSPLPSPERTSTSDTALPQVLAPSQSNPILSRSDTVDHFQWIVENLPYPASTYSITVDKETQHIVIKTSNRKYYKRLDLPELIDRGLQLNQEVLTWRHSQDTLTVSYTKPTSTTGIGPISSLD